MIVFLIGFMGSGKSTTGKELAGRMGYDFRDTDKEIVQEFGMSINEIFGSLGEKVFRDAETRQLKRILTLDNLIVSTGGGLPCQGNNMEVMNRHGKTIYLKAAPGDLYRRLSTRKHKRPLIKDLSDSELLKFIEVRLSEREGFYNKAGIVVDGLGTDIGELVSRLQS